MTITCPQARNLRAASLRGKVRYPTGKTLEIPLNSYRAIGLLGAAFFIGAYFATQQRWLSSDDWRYPAINLVGAILVMVSLFAEWNLPSVVLEAFWAAISVYGLVNRA